VLSFGQAEYLLFGGHEQHDPGGSTCGSLGKEDGALWALITSDNNETEHQGAGRDHRKKLQELEG
jgi:hypothetical protein